MTQASKPSVVILGAGPAGLGLALRLARRGAFDVTVLEKNAAVGGNAGSFELAGLPVDYGSHRLHPSCPAEILDDLKNLLGDDLLDRPRHGRICLRGRWVHFPLKPSGLFQLPPSFVLGAAWDAASKPFRRNGVETFAGVLEHGLGRTICRDFYFPYARKIWGLPPEELSAEQARRRVAAGSVGKLARKVAAAIGVRKNGKGQRFYYPRGGFGQLSAALHRAALDAQADIRLTTPLREIQVNENGVAQIIAENDNGRESIPARHVFSTIPVTVLARSLRPGAPSAVLEAADSLRYRAMILIYLVLDEDRFTEYDAHYFPGSDLRITRLSEPKNYGLREAPGTTVLCAELPCDVGDDAWSMTDEQLGELVERDLQRVGLPLRSAPRQVITRRLPQAYPIYTRDYHRHFALLDDWLSQVDGVTSLGRQGLFAHDNTHHTLAMAYAASDCLSDEGDFDGSRWAECRCDFEAHVVED